MLIGLAGYARSGKDTFANAIVEELEFQRFAFADALKDVLYDTDPQIGMSGPFTGWRLQQVVDQKGWEVAKELTEARVLLQRLGVAVREHVESHAWVRACLRNAVEVKNAVISDVRFPNEAEAIRDLGGTLIRIERTDNAPANDHVSETALDGYRFDIVVANDGTEDSFRKLAVLVTNAQLKAGW